MSPTDEEVERAFSPAILRQVAKELGCGEKATENLKCPRCRAGMEIHDVEGLGRWRCVGRGEHKGGPISLMVAAKGVSPAGARGLLAFKVGLSDDYAIGAWDNRKSAAKAMSGSSLRKSPHAGVAAAELKARVTASPRARTGVMPPLEIPSPRASEELERLVTAIGEFVGAFRDGGPQLRASTEPLWSVERLAAHLKLNRNTVYELTAGGEIPHLKFGRILRYEPHRIRQWLETKTCPVRSPAELAARKRRRD